jgi:hypothetical protein
MIGGPDLNGAAASSSTQMSTPLSSEPVNGNRPQFKTCRSWDELDQLIRPWRSLLDEDRKLTIFTAPEWLKAWWDTFGAGKPLLSFIYQDPFGETKGIAPLYLNRAWDPLFGDLTFLRLVGDGSGDSKKLDFITCLGFEDACAGAFLQWLDLQDDWQVCCFGPFSEDSRMFSALWRQLEIAKWPAMVGISGNAAIVLPPTWQEYLESLEPEFRPLVTRYPRRLSHRYRVRIRRCEEPTQVRSGLELLFALHQKHWNSVDQPGSFSSATRRNFYVQMAAAFLDRGWLELWLLELNSTPVAAQFCFRYQDVAYVLQEGFDPDFASDKVGYALRAAMIKYFIESGTKIYDFLEGFSAHKKHWGATPGRYFNLWFARPTQFGRNYITCNKLASGSKQWLRGHLPDKVWKAFNWVKVHTYGTAELG